jgi:protein gp37
MGKKTSIAWMRDGDVQGGSLNTIIGCSPASPGCANCYAIGECWRKQHNTRVGKDFEGTVKGLPDGNRAWTGRVNFNRERLNSVLEDRSRRCWFANSLSDLFHKNLEEEVILEHFSVFARAYWQEFRCLTKRADRLLRLSPKIKWSANVQMGVSVEDIERMFRIVALGKTGAVHKFVSFEPWLSPWPFTAERSVRRAFPMQIDGIEYRALRDLLKEAGVECCIVGGESGRDKHSPRHFHLDDAAYIMEETKAAGAHPCLKQFGTRWAIATNTYGMRDSDGKPVKSARKGGVKTSWPAHLQTYSQEWPFLKLLDYKAVNG